MAALFCMPALAVQPHRQQDCEVNVPLLAAQHIDIGDVIVANDAHWLTVTYRLHGEAVDMGWRIHQTHLAVAGELASIPQTRGNRWGTNPIPEHFPHIMYFHPDGVTEHTEHLYLADLDAQVGDMLYIAAYAEVDGEGAWGEGTRFNERGNWGMYFLYEVCAQPMLHDMVLVEGGTLAMSIGTRTVDSFYIGRYEVTWAEWQEVRQWGEANGYDWPASAGHGCADDHPVHSVSWYDAAKWSNAKSELDGKEPVYLVSGQVYRSGEFGWDGSHNVTWDTSANGYRLPTEVEWEFAARGGNQTNGYTYSGSNDVNEVGWYRDNSGGAACNLSNGRGTWPVGEKAPNELGLHDMSGNVWEWCWDAGGSSLRHCRGGGWSGSETGCRVAGRAARRPDDRDFSFGFRLARNSEN